MTIDSEFYCTEGASCYLHSARPRRGTGSKAERMTLLPPAKGLNMQCLTAAVSRKGKAYQNKSSHMHSSSLSG